MVNPTSNLTEPEQIEVYGHTLDGFAADGRWLLPSERSSRLYSIGSAELAMLDRGWPKALLSKARVQHISDQKMFIGTTETTLLDIACRYIRNINHVMTTGRGLWLYGPTGAGKTSMASAIAREVAIYGYGVKFIRWDDYLRRLQDYNSRADMYALERIALLVLDDVGRSLEPLESQKSCVVFSNLIRARTNEGLPTIATSNATPYDVSGAWGDSASSMIRNGFLPIAIEANDRRPAADQSFLFGDRQVNG